MSDYSQVNDYSAKDALASGNPEKLILGSDIDDELAGISTAIASKFDSADLASQAQAEAETSNVVLLTPLRLANWADYNAGAVGDLQAFVDPNADALFGWDDSAGAAIGFTLGTGLAFSATTIALSSTAGILEDLAVLADPGADRILGWDESADAAIGFALSTGLTTSGTNILIDTAVVPQLAANPNTFTGANYLRTTRFYDSGGTDYMEFAHNGTDLLVTFANTTELDITGTTFDVNFTNLDFGAGVVVVAGSSASEVGFSGAPRVNTTTAAATHNGKVIGLTTGQTYTIDDTLHGDGTVIGFVCVSGTATIAISGATMYLAGTGFATSGSRTLAAGGIATAWRYDTNTWLISGSGLT